MAKLAKCYMHIYNVILRYFGTTREVLYLYLSFFKSQTLDLLFAFALFQNLFITIIYSCKIRTYKTGAVSI
jgi:hypothetical protein